MRLLAVTFLLCILHRSGRGAIPSILKTCYRDDPGLDDCLKSAIQKGLKDLASGYNGQGFKIKSLDPFYNKKHVLEYRQNQIYGKAVLNNIKVTGFSNSKVYKVRANLLDESFAMEVDMSCPKMLVEAYIAIAGQFNAIHLPGAGGFFNTTMEDLTWTWRIKGLPEERKNQTYINLTQFSMRPNVGNMIIALPTLFGDNTALNQIAKDFTDVYWKEIYNEILPLAELAWGDYGMNYANRIFKKAPYDELFPFQE